MVIVKFTALISFFFLKLKLKDNDWPPPPPKKVLKTKQVFNAILLMNIINKIALYVHYYFLFNERTPFLKFWNKQVFRVRRLSIFWIITYLVSVDALTCIRRDSIMLFVSYKIKELCMYWNCVLWFWPQSNFKAEVNS